MRNIITISIPSSVKKNVDNIMKENKYASVSELFRDAMRSLEDANLVKSIMESEIEFAAGKGKELAVICEKLFRKNPFDTKLKTHKLHGTMREYWAFSISYSYRIGFTFLDRNLVRFHSVGTHDIYEKKS